MSQQTAKYSIQENIELSPYNTLHVNAIAHSFVDITSAEHLQKILEEFRGSQSELFVLGGGSNVLFVDDFKGLILHMAIRGKEIVRENENFVWLKIGAGENWHETVRYCVAKGWGGIENLSLIPGTVGAAPIQNIGAYGVELEGVFESLEAVELATGKKKTFNREECRFGYRDSIFKNELKDRFAVTRVTLKLSKHPEINSSYGAISNELENRKITDPTIRDISEVVMAIRNSKLPDPDDLGNAGSFFKNPIVSMQKYERLKQKYPGMPGYELNTMKMKIPAGWLIEKAGLKGRVFGKVGTYKQQALVIVNHGGATGEEILELATQIRETVQDKFGIELVPEVNIVG